MNENPVNSANQKPGLVMAIAIMTLVNGIFNILWGLGVTSGVVLGTLFIGLICAPITVLPAVLGVFEVIYAIKLLSNPPQPVQPSQAIAILEIVAVISGNVLSAIVGILVLIFYNDPIVKNYFAWLNGQPETPPANLEPVIPAPVERPALPLSESQPKKAEISTAPAPEKPKRTPKTGKLKTDSTEKPKKPAKSQTKKSGDSSS